MMNGSRAESHSVTLKRIQENIRAVIVVSGNEQQGEFLNLNSCLTEEKQHKNQILLFSCIHMHTCMCIIITCQRIFYFSLKMFYILYAVVHKMHSGKNKSPLTGQHS